MIALGLCLLGVFVSFIIIFCLRRISGEGWKNPLSILSGVFGLVFAGAIGYFIKEVSPGQNEFLAYYPVGLAYGALCINTTWAVELSAANPKDRVYGTLYIIAIVVATVLLLLLLLSPTFRSMLP